MSVSNPSQLLINRNPPRSPAHPQLAPTWTSRNSHLASLGSWANEAGPSRYGPNSGGIGPPPNDMDPDSGFEDVEDDEDDEIVEVHPTFHRDAEMPGRVKVVVGRIEFWCHKEILWFASPFFRGLLQGSWAETAPSISEPSPSPSRRESMVSTSSPTDVDTVSLPQVPENAEAGPSRPALKEGESWQTLSSDQTEDSEHKDSVYLDADQGPSMTDILKELREIPEPPPSASWCSPVFGEIAGHSPILSPSNALSGPSSPISPITPTFPTIPPPPPLIQGALYDRKKPHRRRSNIRHSFSSGIRTSSRNRIRTGRSTSLKRPIATVELHEESASAFQDFLFWAYPHLDCKVTWANVENLLALAMKLLVPALQKLCEHFLLTHASGKPVVALGLAEQYGNSELYREASRFVLDQPTWNQEDMDTLSDSTQLKLSQKRTWFLERLLKLGTIDVRKEYICRPDCPDLTKCQMQLDDKWRQAHSAVCRYGPPQPSVAFRCLRQLETFPTNPSLVMPHPLCQSAAKSWVMTLFDRMFQPKVMPSPSSAGTEKYWLWITLSA